MRALKIDRDPGMLAVHPLAQCISLLGIGTTLLGRLLLCKWRKSTILSLSSSEMAEIGSGLGLQGKFNSCNESDGKGSSLQLQAPHCTVGCKMCGRYY
jgi:hypothetical protein